MGTQVNTTPKTALVTGSSSGIGFEVARRFLEAGWNVLLNGRNGRRMRAAAQALGHPRQLEAVAGPTSERTTGASLVRAARERFGGIDLLVNNAGEFAPKAFLDVTDEEFERYLSANLRGTYFTTQAVVRAMIEQG